MLVLSRAENERIMIGDDIAIIVIEIGHGKVKLGIEAPKDVVVHRKEIYDDIKENGYDPRKGYRK